MTLQEFLKFLPAAKKLPITLAPGKWNEHGLEDPGEYPRFVAPTLKVQTAAEVAKSSVLLISAPGAVGKTTLAREIARGVGSPLWNLGQVQVGHGFLTGAIAEAFGDEDYSRVKRELVQGQRALVLDGLDEARLAAGERNFEAFLERLADDFRKPGERPALVLLGREEAVGITSEWLDLLEVPTGRYEIEYFEHTAAVEFITKYMEQSSENRPHERNRAAFEKARDFLLDALQRAVPEGVDPRSLAGYAPVLDLVSDLLDVTNPYADYQDMIREAEKWRRETLVRQMATYLLEREHTKTIDKIQRETKRGVGPAFNWTSAYRPDEQCLRLLSKAASFPLEDRPPRDLPAELRDSYEQKLGQWVEDHPFVSQPLFMDYVYAWLFTREDAPVGLLSAIREHLRGTPKKGQPYRPTPLLARFVADFCAGDTGRREIRVDTADLGFVYESLLAGAVEGQSVKLTLISFAEDTDILGEITVGTLPDVPQSGERLIVRLQDRGAGIWFWRRLSSADIQVTQHVRIGAVGGEFLLGPDVEVECSTLRCESSAVRVRAPNEEIGVVLTAQTYDGEAVLLGRHEERVGLHVDWVPVKHPWSRYARSREHIKVTPEMWGAFLKLRTILVRFRAEGYKDMARHEDLITKVTRSGLAHNLLRFCEKRRLIRSEPPLYALDRNTLNQLGIHWQHIRDRHMSTPIVQFLQEFLQSES